MCGHYMRELLNISNSKTEAMRVQYHHVLLSSKNVEFSGKKFMENYSAATSVFNGFYGSMARCANNAFNDAQDAYEGTKEYRMQTKKMFQDCTKAWDKFWRMVRFLFEDKYYVYMDFINNAVDGMDIDMQKLYFVVHSLLLKMNIQDTERRAHLYVADIMMHQLYAVYKRFLVGIVKETGQPRLADTFTWADLSHVESLTHDLLRRLCPVDIEMDDNILLAVQIIAQKAFSGERQDEAAIKALEYKGNEMHREAMKEDIEEYKKHIAEVRRERKEANEAYARKKEEERKRKRRSREEMMTADAIADKLANRFKVTKTTRQ